MNIEQGYAILEYPQERGFGTSPSCFPKCLVVDSQFILDSLHSLGELGMANGRRFLI
jgi:hypothetical protein